MSDVGASVCSLIVVNFNGSGRLERCLASIHGQEYPHDLLDVIVVDNGSSDGSAEDARRVWPEVRVLRNTENNFARALNLGVAAARGRCIAFINNDVVLDPRWLTMLVGFLQAEPDAGAAGGKTLMLDGSINSVGIRDLPDDFWEDIGIGEADRGQYDGRRDVTGLCWAAVLFRRECLDDVGPVDEDFVMYVEDVEYAVRCRARGWRFLYDSDARAHHEFQGSSRGTGLAAYYTNRNRLLYLAKHRPRELPGALRTSHFFLNRQLDLLFDCMPATIKKLVECQETSVTGVVLPRLCAELEVIYGPAEVDRLLQRMEVVLGLRRMSLGIYDQALHVIGGGQKYTSVIATVVQDEFDVTFITNVPARLTDLEAWYRLDLSRCRLKVVPLAFYEHEGLDWIDSTRVRDSDPNPFEEIAEESRRYDVFLNANMLEKVAPRSPLSVFVCHFPEHRRNRHFGVDRYSLIVASSEYGAMWTRRRWRLTPTMVLYPGVDMEAPAVEKEPLILSVARFEVGGSKKQKEMIRAFRRLLTDHREEMEGWRLVLCGGSLGNNRYLDEVRRLVADGPGPIDVLVNAPVEDVQRLYARASIFWHACGLNETNPHLVEHFGMTTVEAMQNRCAPVVINGGGQREIVEHGRSGFLFETLNGLCEHTRRLINDPGLRRKLQDGAWERSHQFSGERFQANVRRLFDLLHQEYATVRRPLPDEVLRIVAAAR